MKFNIKKITAVLFSGILAAFSLSAETESLIPANTVNFNVSAEEVVPEGYTPIHNIEELYAVRNDLEGNYILMNDIDMTEDTAPGGDWDINGTGWEPIGHYGMGGDADEPFEGEFNGNGHAIIGMNIHGDVQYMDSGLFGRTNFFARIYNLKMLDVNININSSKASSYDTTVGSICGYSGGGVLNCFSDGEMNINDITYIGGIVGYNGYLISDCYSLINIKGTEHKGTRYIGGIAGYTVFHKNDHITNCYNIGNITDKSESGTDSGAISYVDAGCENCYYLAGTCEGQNSISGKCQSMSVAQMKSAAAFTNWDFENIWVIDSTSSYKYPQLRSCMQVPVTEVEFSSYPEKTTYTAGDKLDLTGGKVLVNHVDNSSGELEIKENMLGEYNMEEVGKQSITVNYINKSVSYNIMVNPQPVSDLKISSLTDDSVSISWDKVSGAAGYVIYKYDAENEEWNECQRVTKANFTDDAENLSSSDFKYAVSSYVTIDDVDYISEKTEIEVFKPIDFSHVIIDIDDIICTNETQTVVPEVRYNGKLLTEGVDYDITGGDYEVKTPGQYKLVLSGKGRFAGDQEVEFNAVCEHDWGEDGKSNICAICGEKKYLIGDITGNGEIDLYDAIEIAKYMAGKRKFTAEEMNVADTNRDGIINLYDAIEIAKYLVKKNKK